MPPISSVGARKSPLSEIVERLGARACARWLFAGCLLSGSFDATASIYVVNTTGDPGPAGTLSLRQAWNQAIEDPAGVVEFDSSLRDSTITLTQTPILNQPHPYAIYVIGPGSQHLTISGNGEYPVFAMLQGGGVLGLTGVTITHGGVPAGMFPLIGGAGVVAKYSTLKLDDVTITGCHSGHYGGAVLVRDGDLDMRNSTITGNSSQQGGGGIQLLGNSSRHNNLDVFESTISYNTTYGYGAGIAISYTDYARVLQSLVSGNKVYSPSGDAAGGGGISVKTVYKGARIINSTIYNNYVYAMGGGVGLFDAMSAQKTQINFSTIVGNYSGFGNGANGVHTTAGFTINSSIVANNFNRYNTIDIDGSVSADHSLILNIGGAIVSGRYNIFQTDPKLGTLTNNGGPTRTMLPKVGSPVIDAGGSVGTLVVDQRNDPRLVGAATDIGAVERQTKEDEIFVSGFDSS